MENTYWGGNGKYEDRVAALDRGMDLRRSLSRMRSIGVSKLLGKSVSRTDTFVISTATLRLRCVIHQRLLSMLRRLRNGKDEKLYDGR
jgi:hypothetical protein